MNALFERLRSRILEAGPLSIAQYMEAAMTDPDYGYYTTGDPIGARGDFITAPEISQIFGELIGLWSASVWQSLGQPAMFRWVELGPGRGTLMADAVRATANVPGFHAAARLHMIDASPVLKAVQQKALSDCGISRRAWHHDVSKVPEGPAICIANEFFDALPVRHFQNIAGGGWRERVIGLNSAGDGLEFLLSEQQTPEHLIPEALRMAPDSALVETSPLSLEIMHILSGCVTNSGGAVLIIDYGHCASAHGETLQALQNHKFADVLEAPGEQDLTAHVDFAALGHIAKDAGTVLHGPVGQGDFLNNLGLGLRVRALMDSARTAQQSRDVFERANRLVDPEQMGSLFKVLGISSPELGPLPAL